MRATRWLLVLAAALGGGCASSGGGMGLSPDVPAALAVREAQTRRYEGVSRPQAMLAVTQALQDAGFQIRTAETELGLVTAVQERSEGNEASGFVKTLFWYPYLIPFRGLLPKRTYVVIEVTATVSEQEGGARVRLAAHSRLLDKDGRLKETRVVDDPRLYQELLARIDKALFLERERL